MAAGYDGSIRINTKIDGDGFNSGIRDIQAGLRGITASLRKVAVAMGLAFGVGAIIDGGKKSVAAATELSNALTGLQSILDGQGRSFFKAQKFINSYIQDGLIPATQAITAYKNLALRGYDDSQIQQVMIALKDSAAFGRQASYNLGEAVSSATEGLKNENSILVDNAGITKNVAKMWDEYAKSIGTTANNLTQQQKIQAEVIGILEESKYQVGDAAKVAGTFSGQLLQLQYRFNDLKVAIGNALIPIAQAVMPSINAMITGFTRLANIVVQVSTALFGKQVVQQGKVAATAGEAAKGQKDLAAATTAAGKAAKGAISSFDELNILQQRNTAGASEVPEPLGFDGADVGGELFGNVTVSPTVQAAIDTLKALLEPLKNINLDNLKTAFDGLKASLEPLTKAVFDGLHWAYENLFVPLATWVMETYLPALLGYWAAALKVLNEIIEALKPAAIWLWENFLLPIAEWTGGAIVSIIEAITEALTGFSDWASKNRATVENMGLAIAGFLAGIWVYNTVRNIVRFMNTLATTLAVLAGKITVAGMASMLASVGFALLLAGILLIAANWGKMNGIEKTIAILGSIAIAAAAAAAAVGALQSAWSLGIAAAAIVAGIALIAGAVKSANSDVQGQLSSFEAPNIKAPTFQIPKLATGAVIPPNAEFLAVLGDQKHGRNLEGPESLFRQMLQEEVGGMLKQGSGNNEGGKATITLDGRVLGEFVIRYINDKTQVDNVSPILI